MTVLITAGPPTPNGDLHVGHLSGPFIAGDVYRRFLQARGIEAFYISGSDDHQSYVATKARQLGTSPRELAASATETILGTLTAAGVEMDHYSQPAESRRYQEFIQRFFSKLHEEGKLVEKTAPALYCDGCDGYLFEAGVRGCCAHCGSEADGGICEECGRPNGGEDLIDARCGRCGAAAGRRDLKRLFFPLDEHRESVADYLRSANMSPHVRALGYRMLAGELPLVPATQVADWGLPVPVPGYERQRISAWLELGPYYLAVSHEMKAVGATQRSWKELWSQEVEVVQFFGFDSGYFHTLLFPALFRAFDPAIRPPVSFVVNEFYRLDGKKFSTSRNHAIWGSDFLAEVPSDAARFYVALTRPEIEQTNFTRAEFDAWAERELQDLWDGWLLEMFERLFSETSGVSPRAGSSLATHQRFRRSLDGFVREVSAGYEPATFSLRRVARSLCELVRQASEFGREEAHMAGVDECRSERQTSLALELAAAKTLALLAAPLMPDFSARLWHDLGYRRDSSPGPWPDAASFVPAGQRLRRPSELYFAAPDDLQRRSDVA